eukprot:366198-Chlamydomonas_euryale.AAC.8
MASLVDEVYGVPFNPTLTVRSHAPWLQTVQRATLLHGMCVHDADLRHHHRAARARAFAVAAECERRFTRTTVPDLGLSNSHWHVGIGKRGGGSVNTRLFGGVVVPLHRERCIPLDALEGMRLGFA